MLFRILLLNIFSVNDPFDIIGIEYIYIERNKIAVSVSMIIKIGL